MVLRQGLQVELKVLQGSQIQRNSDQPRQEGEPGLIRNHRDGVMGGQKMPEFVGGG